MDAFSNQPCKQRAPEFGSLLYQIKLQRFEVLRIVFIGERVQIPAYLDMAGTSVIDQQYTDVLGRSAWNRRLQNGVLAHAAQRYPFGISA